MSTEVIYKNNPFGPYALYRTSRGKWRESASVRNYAITQDTKAATKEEQDTQNRTITDSFTFTAGG